jgi:hypothetical protein
VYPGRVTLKTRPLSPAIPIPKNEVAKNDKGNFEDREGLGNVRAKRMIITNPRSAYAFESPLEWSVLDQDSEKHDLNYKVY